MTCRYCNDTGRVKRTITCPKCRGTGRVMDNGRVTTCPECNGDKTITFWAFCRQCQK